MIKSVVFLISFYQVAISPALKLFWPAGSCLYRPTCSQYFKEAVQKYGVVTGTKYGIKRIARCNPASMGGFDPLT